MASAASWTPLDSFGARLALVRQQMGGWNVKRMADHCGIQDASWHNWESDRIKPRDLHAVCRTISDATGVDYVWLMVGGPLRSRCFADLALELAG